MSIILLIKAFCGTGSKISDVDGRKSGHDQAFVKFQEVDILEKIKVEDEQ